MIIGFGFGSPLVSLLMLIATSLISYRLYKLFRRLSVSKDFSSERERRRNYYIEQRERAQQMMRKYNLTDDEIEKRLDDEFRS